jgi:hypothetical protein
MSTGSFTDAAAGDQRVDARDEVLLRLAQQYGSSFWSSPDQTRQIVQFQDRATQAREYIGFCSKTLTMIHNYMFPRNKQPENVPDLMGRFKNVSQVQDFIRAQLVAGARFCLIMIQICFPKLDLTGVVDLCFLKLKKRRRNVDKINEVITPVAERMIGELLRMDSEYLTVGVHESTLAASAAEDRINIDDLLGSG